MSSDPTTDFSTLLEVIYLPGWVEFLRGSNKSFHLQFLCRFPGSNKVPDLVTPSSLLRNTAKHEIPAVWSPPLGVVRDAHPETLEGIAPSKPLAESVFGGPTPHIHICVTDGILRGGLRGREPLMDRRPPASVRLPPPRNPLGCGTRSVRAP